MPRFVAYNQAVSVGDVVGVCGEWAGGIDGFDFAMSSQVLCVG